MKFVLLRHIQVRDGSTKKQVLIEWDEKKIKKEIADKITESAGFHAVKAFESAFDKTLD
jgi:hypothetical protein